MGDPFLKIEFAVVKEVYCVCVFLCVNSKVQASEDRAEELNDGVPVDKRRHISLLTASIQAKNIAGPYISNVEIATSDNTGVMEAVRKEIYNILGNAV